MPPERLRAVLDCLLPGNDHWPSAGSLCIEVQIANDLGDLLSEIDGSLTVADSEHMRSLEIARPDLFGRLLAAAYERYYSHPEVLSIVEARTGFPARPPQPLGHELPPFDENLLAKVKQRNPFWRPA